jgi:short-subunit dehydrogenase/NAD dependent epimerase/dehydratase family enzyme
VKNTHYLVTGANGFIGSRLCIHLAAAGKRVTGQIRRSTSPTLERNTIPIVSSALEDLGRYATQLSDVTHVVHLAGDPRFGNGPQYRASNVITTEVLIDQIKRFMPQLQRLVLVSTIGTIDRAVGDPCIAPLNEQSRPNPTSDYGRSKLEAEKIVKASGLPFTIVRPSMVVGETMRANSHMATFAAMAVRRGLLSRLDLPGTLSTIHVDDLASAIETVSEHQDAQGHTFFAAGSLVRLGDLFSWVDPSARRLPIRLIVKMVRPALRYLPFAAKVLLCGALVADDTPLRALGWTPTRNGQRAFESVIVRERRRRDPSLPGEGMTVVTGAASGLGRMTAHALHARGRRLLLVDRDVERLAEVLKDDPMVQRVRCDLSNEQDIKTLIGSTIWKANSIDELYACAGFGLRGEVISLSADSQADIYRVNIISRLMLTCAVIPEMRERGFGRIVLISSSSAFQPLPWMAAYASSNAAILSFAEAVSYEISGSGVEMYVICPGGMKTAFQERAGVKELPNEKLLAPEHVVDQLFYAVRHRRQIVIVSLRAKMMNLMARVLPRRVSILIWGRLMSKLR